MKQGRDTQPNKYLTHRFQPRQHGSKLACEWCGAAQVDPIHKVPYGIPVSFQRPSAR